MQSASLTRQLGKARLGNVLRAVLFVGLGVYMVGASAAWAQAGRQRGFRAPMARPAQSKPNAPQARTDVTAPASSQAAGRQEDLAQPEQNGANRARSAGDQNFDTGQRMAWSGQGSPGPRPGQNRPMQIDPYGRPAPGSRGNVADGGLINPNRPSQAQQHLGEWMNAHSGLSLDQQQRALEAEPGFRQLPPQAQQRLHMRLQQLNTMPAGERARVTQRTEAMERLTPPQRQQVRDAYAQLGGLPEDRRRAVARAFYSTLALPPGERGTYLNSPQMRGQFNDRERDTLNKLITAPYLPAPAPTPRPQ